MLIVHAQNEVVVPRANECTNMHEHTKLHRAQNYTHTHVQVNLFLAEVGEENLSRSIVGRVR